MSVKSRTMLELGCSVIVALDEIVYVGLEGSEVRLLLRGSGAMQVLKHETAGLAAGRYAFLRKQLGFGPHGAEGIAFSGSGRAAVETALASVEEPVPSPALREQAARAAQILVTLSDASIRALRVEAAGDEYLTGICDRALDEDLDALEQVAEIMAERELGERAAREQDEPAEDPEEDPRVGEARDW